MCKERNCKEKRCKERYRDRKKLENLNVKIGNYKVYIKFNSWSSYVFFTYCLLATLMGEIFCSIADIIFGCIFGYNPFSCKDSLEDCLPWEENSGNSENRNKNLQIKASDFKSLEEKILEFSELHFIISRNMAGLALVLSIVFCFLSPVGTIIAIANLTVLTQLLIHREKYIIPIGIIALLFISYLLAKTIIVGAATIFILALEALSIIYRIQANRIIIHGKKNKLI